MPDIVVRAAQPGDQDGFHTVRSLTYNNGDPIPPERRIFPIPETRTFVAESGGQIAGVCNVLDFTASRGEATLRCGAIAGVAVLPEERRSGVGSALMCWTVRHLRENQVQLASLYAFRESYYRKFGYEVAGRRLKITCPTNRWPKLEARLPVRRLTPSDWEQLVGCYTAFARRRSGLNMRTEKQWARVLGENRQLTIYAVGEPVEAYAVVSHVTAFWTTDHISEIAWSSREGYETLLSMLSGLAINKTALSWFEPSDGPFYTNFLDQGIDVCVERPIMFRVNDVPGALRAMKPAAEEAGEFVFQVEDRVVPENAGPWRVRFAEGGVEVDLATGGSPDFQLDVRHFAQAFLGEPSLNQLAEIGDIQVFSPNGLGSAQRLLTPRSAYCMDFF